jgi:hypothetical protein
MRKILGVLFSATVLMTACTKDKVEVIDGVKIQIHSHDNNAKKLKDGDIITFDLVIKNGADSVLQDGSAIGKGLYRSKDGGLSWHSFFISGYPVYDIPKHPTIPKYMLAACGNGGLYASKSFGEAWEKVEMNGLQDSSIRRVFIPDLEEGPGEDGGFKAYVEVFNSGLHFSTEFIKPTLVSVEDEIEFGSSLLVDVEGSEPALPQVLVLPPGLREEIQSRNKSMIVAPDSSSAPATQK